MGTGGTDPLSFSGYDQGIGFEMVKFCMTLLVLRWDIFSGSAHFLLLFL